MLLHLTSSNNPVIVNPANVTEIYEYGAGARIEFCNTDYVDVTETLDEIKRKLGMSWYEKQTNIDLGDIIARDFFDDDEEAEIIAGRTGEE